MASRARSASAALPEAGVCSAGHAGGHWIGGVDLGGIGPAQGQRQRIAITRAVLAVPRTLILDGATSSVDARAEVQLQHTLRTLMEGGTSFVIAHRLSTIRHADRIYVLERGRVLEAGRHEHLLALGGAYAALWRVQTGERWRSAAD